MKCINCKLLKHEDGKYTCPAHPWVTDINLDTEHRNCGADRWYPRYAKDRAYASLKQIAELECAIEDVERLINQLSDYGIQRVDMMKGEIRLTVNKYLHILEDLRNEHERWSLEVKRLEAAHAYTEEGQHARS